MVDEDRGMKSKNKEDERRGRILSAEAGLITVLISDHNMTD